MNRNKTTDITNKTYSDPNPRLAELSSQLRRLAATQNADTVIKNETISALPKYELIDAWVNFQTQQEDKDMESRLYFHLDKIGSPQIAFGLEHGQIWYPPNQITANRGMLIEGKLKRNEIFDLRFTVEMERFSGTDVWMYQPIVSLMFDDGTIFSKKFEIDVLSEGRKNIFAF